MRLELNKFYKHNAGKMIHTIAEVESPIMWFGPMLIAESPDGSLMPCGKDKDSTVNWKEIQKSEFMAELNPEHLRYLNSLALDGIVD